MCMTAKTPGPGNYLLPPNVGYKDHDVRKRRLPQFSFGMRLNITNESVGPGPGAYFVGKVTHKGKFESHKFSMYPKINYNKDDSRSPGPAYTDVNLKPILKGVRGPQYSFQSKHYPPEMVVPAPNSYNIEEDLTHRKPPKYSIAPMIARKTVKHTPGPADYGGTNVKVLLKKSPEFSIVGRKCYSLKEGDITPGPYNCSNYKPGIKGFSYSFGSKHSPCIVPIILPCDN